jgi:nicotinamidase-related amidase
MNAALSIDPKTSALLVMDFQNATVDAIPTDKNAFLARTAALVESARNAGMKVIYVVVGFRPGYPEASPRNHAFAQIRSTGRFIAGSADTEVHAGVAPKPDDVIVMKRRVSAFWGTDLEVILRAHAIETLVLAGIATSGVVLSTIRHAADADYRVLVVEDCCADRDPEVHRVLMEKVFVRQSAVVKAGDVTASISSKTG